ncbi:MAG: M14 family metallopeptidase, partial [Candidatus Aminicenantes bacterium]|nr:M14 family metallopeptidase [Candidatus Aminicenantes bacterium]
MNKWFITAISSLCVILLLICSPLFAQKSPQKPNLNALQEAPQNPNWEKYHSTDEAYALLESWAALYPDLTNLYSIGQTLKGTPLKVLEITNKQTGAALEKPGYYYDGNIHSGELTAAEVILHFAWYLLSHYGKDPYVTRLVDTRTFYLRPKFNPDGADIALNTPLSLRSTPRPYDEDRDGLLDEDPPNDLNQDGSITLMRVRNLHGLWKVSPQDPRIMVHRETGDSEGEFYHLYSEGIDDDGDGYFNEDGIGGIDMNRNFPRNWGMEFQQRGA